MSEATLFEDAILEGLKELLDARPESDNEIGAADAPVRKKRKRKRAGENERPTALQLRYQRQVRGRLIRKELVEPMSRMVAWTWMPGKDRTVCPPVVDLRDPRFLVMDRFPHESTGACDQIGLTMFRSAINRQGVVSYGSPDQIEMFKDFAIRPHFRAGGMCLDSRNEEVFRHALALDHTMELVARDKLDATDGFVPPQCLFGFPKHYLPSPEWRLPMQEAVLRMLHPDSPMLRCLLSPGGLVVGVLDAHDGFRTINIEKNGNLIQVKLPNWVILRDATYKDGVTLEGQPLADLPRGAFSRIKDVTAKYPFKSLEWLERRILEELTELISVDEEVWDKQTKARIPSTTVWRCVPSQFVQNQVGRAVRYFLDMRHHLGRKSWTIDSFENDIFTEDAKHCRIDVLRFDSRPAVSNTMFDDGVDGKNRSWIANLMEAPEGAIWLGRCPLRGVLPPAVSSSAELKAA